MAQISDALLKAIRMVESGGNENVGAGDGGKAIGPYQIHPNYYKDAVEHNPNLTANGQCYENSKGPGSTEYAGEVVKSYMDRYANERRLGHPPTDEDFARIHNGGPNGYKKAATESYWQKVEKHMK